MKKELLTQDIPVSLGIILQFNIIFKKKFFFSDMNKFNLQINNKCDTMVQLKNSTPIF